jgi:hypothetical protein
VTGTGLSGANIELLLDGTVAKTGGDVARTIAQAEWLNMFTDNMHLPRVLQVGSVGYRMERLTPVPADYRVPLTGVLSILREGIWPQRPGPMVKWHREATERKVLDIYAAVEAPADVIGKTLDRFDSWHEVELGTAHGDPTFENVMIRHYLDGREFDLVLIDPIPPTPAVPDVVGVDAGKLIQSALGWERAKGEQSSAWDLEDVQANLTPSEYLSGTDWVIVHLARTLPYATKHRPELREWVFDAIRQAVDL